MQGTGFTLFVAVLLSSVVAGCATPPAYVPDPSPLQPGRLPPPDIAVSIPGLGNCSDEPDRTLRLNSAEPVTVLVHGCKGSAGRFRTLAQLYAFHGHVCAPALSRRDGTSQSPSRLRSRRTRCAFASGCGTPRPPCGRAWRSPAPDAARPQWLNGAMGWLLTPASPAPPADYSPPALRAFRGSQRQAVCFSYDDRDSLMRSSRQLIDALDALAGAMQNRSLTVMGHSMGGLVTRKALEQDRPDAWRRDDVELKLLTVSAPFAGIGIARPCGYTAAQWLSLGVVPGICRLVTGDNWYEITWASDFIRRPGPLLPVVQRFLKVVTDERDTCRRHDPLGRCLESDYVFSLAEQYQPAIERLPQLTNVEVEAGHVEIVGDRNIQPRKLLEILQQQGFLAPTPPERRAALERLLAELY